MRKIRDAMRLAAAGLSTRKIAASLGVGQSTVSDYLSRARAAGLSWPLPGDLADAELEGRLFPRSVQVLSAAFPQPDWAHVHAELRRKGVTLALLWEEYRGIHTDGYGYSRYCELYRRWEGRLSPVMRQHHVAGERLFVDYAGATLEVVCPQTAKCAKPSCSSPHWGPRTIPMPRRRGRRPYRTGSQATCAPSPSSAALRRRWCRTI